MTIPWNCDTCRLPIEDRKGYVWISPRRALRRMQEIEAWRPGGGVSAPEVLNWQAMHEACETDPEGPEYWWDIERLRTPAGVEEFRSHLAAKVWSLTATDLESFVERASARTQAAPVHHLRPAS